MTITYVKNKPMPFQFRIMIDRGLTRPEAANRPEVMDLCPEGGTFEEKFQTNQLASAVGQVSFLSSTR